MEQALILTVLFVATAILVVLALNWIFNRHLVARYRAFKAGWDRYENGLTLLDSSSASIVHGWTSAQHCHDTLNGSSCRACFEKSYGPLPKGVD